MAGTHLLILLCFVFFSQFKPSEPFLVDYFVDNKGLTNHQVFSSIFNLFAYARLPFVIVVGVFTQVPRCGGGRFVLVAGAVCGLTTVLLTRFGETLMLQQAAQFTVAASFSSHLVVAAFAMALVPPSRFQETCHVVKAVLLLSNFSSAILGELLRDHAGVALDALFDISAVSQALALLFALLLPRPAHDEALGIVGDTDSVYWEAVSLEEDLQEEGPCRTCRCTSFHFLEHLREPLEELWVSLRLRGVMWWTAWGMAMNPAHGLAMVYWQSLLRSKHIKKDHNGYLLASMYFVSAMLLLALRKEVLFRHCTACLAIGSMLLAGFLLCQVVSASNEVMMYGWLFLYQCMFQVMCVVRTFQIGAEVTQAFGDHSDRTRRCARLSLLFSVTAVAFHFSEALFQAAINIQGLTPLQGIGSCLAVFAVCLFVARCGEAALKRDATGSDRAELSSLALNSAYGPSLGARGGAVSPHDAAGHGAALDEGSHGCCGHSGGRKAAAETGTVAHFAGSVKWAVSKAAGRFAFGKRCSAQPDGKQSLLSTAPVS